MCVYNILFCLLSLVSSLLISIRCFLSSAYYTLLPHFCLLSAVTSLLPTIRCFLSFAYYPLFPLFCLLSAVSSLLPILSAVSGVGVERGRGEVRVED